MKKILLLAVSVSVLLTSCELFNSHGKKFNYNEKNEVYYKGDDATEKNAKDLGKFLEEMGYFNGEKAASVQIVNENDSYLVRFVYDKKYFDENKDHLGLYFWYLQDRLSELVFEGKVTSVTLADKNFEDFEKFEKVNKVAVNKSNHVYFKGNGVSKSDAEEIGEKLDKEKFFDFTGGDILLTKTKGEYNIRFLPSTEMVQENEEKYISLLQNLQYIFSKYTIGETVKLIVINSGFEDIKNFGEPTDAQKLFMDQAMQNGLQTNPDQGDDKLQTKTVEYDVTETTNN